MEFTFHHAGGAPSSHGPSVAVGGKASIGHDDSGLILRDPIVSGRMLFGQAVEHFREFLCTQGHSGPLVWIVPADVVFWFGELLIRPTINTETHAEQF